MTETATYTTGDKHVRVHYAVTNNGASAVPIRATVGGDVTPHWDEGGGGQFKATAPRQVATIDPAGGASVRLEEVSGVSAFDGWWEDDVIEVWRRVRRPLSDGLKCVEAGCTPGWTNPGDGDKALAVQFDDHRDTPLAVGATADFEVVWRFTGYDALTLTDPANADTPLYQSVTATATSVQEDGTTPNTDPILYRRTGANPFPSDGGWEPATIGDPGEGTIPSWQGSNPGTDWLEVFVDSNNDGARQDFEARESQSVYWFRQIEVYWYDWTYTGEQTTAEVRLYDDQGLGFDQDFEWWVEGPNATGSSASPHVGQTDLSGYAEVSWPGSYEGTDRLFVRADLNQDFDNTDPGETYSVTGWWYGSIEAYATDNDPTVGTPAYFYVYDYNSAVSGPIRWRVDAGPQSTVTMNSGSGSFQYTSNISGQDVVMIYQDVNSNSTWNAGEPRVDQVVDWVAPSVNRLTISPATQQTKLVGGSASWTLALKDQAGLTTDGAVRYEITSGPNDTGGDELEVASSGGQATINLTDTAATGGTDQLYAYADNDNDNTRDANEPAAQGSVRWSKQVDLSVAPTYHYLGTFGTPGSATATVKLRDSAGALTSGDFTWEIVSGPNAGVSGAGSVTDAAAGETISWPGTTTGADVLVVTATIGGVERTATVQHDWYNELSLTPTTKTLETDQTASVQPYLSSYGSNANRVYRWKREGVSTPTPDPVYGTAVANSSGAVQPITWTSDNLGEDTLTVWVDIDGSGGTEPTAGDEVTVASVTWIQDQVSIDVPSDLSVGATAAATASLRTTDNLTIIGEALRYRVYGQHTSSGKLFDETNGLGEIEFSWQGTTPGTDTVEAWVDTDRDGYWDTTTERGDREQVRWHPLIDVVSADTSLYEGDTQNVTVTLRNAAYQPQSRPLKYRIQGANAKAATTITPDATTGEAPISWVGYEPGSDTLDVWEDTTADGVPGSGELKTTIYLSWSSRVVLSGEFSTKATGSQRTINATVKTVTGALVPAGTPVRWERTGANPATGTQTSTTGTDGKIAITWTGTYSGQDVLKVWHDSLSANGERDPGEPQASTTVSWTNQISLSPTNATKWVGEQHSVTVGGSLSTNLRYAITGSNPASGATSQGATIQWTGTNAGYDQLVVWQDQNTDGDRDGGEPASGAYVTWQPVVDVDVQNSNLTAGVTGAARIVTYTGTGSAATPTLAPNTQVTWQVTGVNPAGPTTTTTDGDGDLTVNWPTVNAGTDTVKVWLGASNAGAPIATDSVTWNAPPVAVSLTPTSQTKYAGNTQQFTATVTGTTIPPGGVPITWSVTGANPQSGGPTNTDNAGVLTFNVTGTSDGIDTVRVDADLAGNFDPHDTSQMTWLPLVEIPTGTSRTPTIGTLHEETVRLLDPALSTPGNPVGLANTNVLWELEAGSANATSGIQARAGATYRPVGSGTTTTARSTDGSGYVTIGWTGANAGTDNLVVYGDTNNDGVVQANEPRARTSVVWASATSTGTAPTLGTTTGTTTGTTAQVPPESDFDGFATPPPPVTGRAVNIEPVSGRVLVRLPGSSRFIDLKDAEQVPVGTVVDVRKGRVELTSTKDLKGGVQAAQFYAGMFKIGQKRAAKPVTDLALFGGNFKGCPKPAKGGAARASAKKKPVRKLWGTGKGQFRTRGRFASAVLRGTDWETQDLCTGTLVRVAKGLVAVTDLVKKRTVLVRARKQYFAAAKRR